MNKQIPSVLASMVLILGLGTTVLRAQDGAPRRIVSLAPSLTEALCMLGAQDRIVGATRYCRMPVADLNWERIATAVSVNVEKTLLLQPDLVVCTKLTSLRDVRALEQLGLRVEIFEQPKTFQALCDDFLRIGHLVAADSAAQAIVSQARDGVAALTSQIPKEHQPKAFVQIGAKPLFVATNENFLSDMLRLAGAENPAADWPSGVASREALVAADPEALFIVTMGVAAQEEKETWMAFDNLAAAKNKAVYVLDADTFCSPSPLTFVKALGQLIDLLHPELSEETP